MRPQRVVVIGLGSRGLSVLERIVTLAALPEHRRAALRVDVVDPRADGTGLHAVDQPDYLLLNTIAAQLSMFADSPSVPAGTATPGPNLYEWVRARGLRVADDGYTLSAHGRPVRPDDFLPRRVLGEYLRWFLQQVLARVPAHVEVVMHATTAVELAMTDDGWCTRLADGTALASDFAFLTTGHIPNAGRARRSRTHRMIRRPYPLPAALAHVRSGDTVAVAGFGLSAMDVIAALTVGRGGRFDRTSGTARYRPSGREPRMLLYSRTGLPYRARPAADLMARPYEPLVFTQGALTRLQTLRRRPLDLREDILPLLFTEMRMGFHRCRARLTGAPAARELESALAAAAMTGFDSLVEVLDRADARVGRFDPETELRMAGPTCHGDRHVYEQQSTAEIAADLEHARAGLARSPLKAGLELLRTLRDVIRHAVEFDSLSDDSFKSFTADFVPAMNRAVTGPQAERSEELLALLDAGLAAMPFGAAPEVTFDARLDRWTIRSTHLDSPWTQTVEWICNASIDATGIDSASSLIAGLRRAGLIRRYRAHTSASQGIDLTPQLHPVTAAGDPVQTLWTLGPLCEGPTFYNHVIPSPDGSTRPLRDAHRCVAEMFGAGWA